MGGDHEVVTGPHDHDGVVVFEAEPGATSKQGDPLVRVLVVPLVGRRRVAGGDDALEPATPSLHKHVDELRCWGGGKSGVKGDYRLHLSGALILLEQPPVRADPPRARWAKALPS